MSSGKPKMMTRGGLWTPTASKLPARRRFGICGIVTCTRMQLWPKHGRKRDATQLASSGPIPTRTPLSSPRHRSRLVCTEVRHKGVEQVFSAAPPVEALRALISISRQEDVPQVADPLLISIADVSKAHFNADAVRNVYVRLPEEDSTMYGTLDAATVERALCTGLRMRRILTGPGIPVPLLPQEPADLENGDDCFIVGRQKGREHAWDLLQAVYELSKVVTLGPGPSLSQAVTFLGRTQTLRKWRIQYEPDKQHVPRSLKALGLTGVRCVCHPGNC